MVVIFTSIVVCLFIVLIGWVGIQTGKSMSDEVLGKIKAESKQSDKERMDLIALNAQSAARVLDLESQLRKTVSQKKSSEVRTGMIVEQMAPFLEGFPYAPEKATFLARPIDFLVFDDDGVHFIEVKSGKAQLSSKQRIIRDQIQENKVTFEVYRIKGE